MIVARSIRVRGVVQGVGFRPFVFKLAQAQALAGWVANRDDGVEVRVQGPEPALATFLRGLEHDLPPAARVVQLEVEACAPVELHGFTITESTPASHPSARMSPDLPVCDACVAELFDPDDRRYRYPYNTCSNCGPRFSIIEELPYDRPRTTMRAWVMDAACAAEYHDPSNRRFHAQPIACPACGPGYRLLVGDPKGSPLHLRESQALLLRSGDPSTSAKATADKSGSPHEGGDNCQNSIVRAAQLLANGAIVAIKGIGGYHLACDAGNGEAVQTLRERKFRKEKPFALMARNLTVAEQLVALSPDERELLSSAARPIVLARKRDPASYEDVAPDGDELGIMLPSTPLHALLFDAGAPETIVLTSANRSSEPIAYEDADALTRLRGIADAFLIGERPIARRVDDSVVRASAAGPVMVRRARGYAPDVVAEIPASRPLLAVGGDLKNSITLVVDRQAFVSQHIGDLDDAQCRGAFAETIDDLLRMYQLRLSDVAVAHDAHPGYASTQAARELTAAEHVPIQHHRAHIASVLAEHGDWDRRVIGIACDGTGYGDDGRIWGGEIFLGSVRAGFARVAHLREASLPGGDAAAAFPAQAAAGFLAHLDGLPNLADPPFGLPAQFSRGLQLVRRGVRVFPTTSVGRLFDTAAALVGFVRPVTFEGQAAMWLEQQARRATMVDPYEMPFGDGVLDYTDLLREVIRDRQTGRSVPAIARAFHLGVARGLAVVATRLCREHGLDTVVVSGGVFQNELLLSSLRDALLAERLQIWSNHRVPANDGGLSLGQAAIAALGSDARPH